MNSRVNEKHERRGFWRPKPPLDDRAETGQNYRNQLDSLWFLQIRLYGTVLTILQRATIFASGTFWNDSMARNVARPPLAKLEAPIIGDVTVATVAVNTKGGSVSATFKKPIRGNLDPHTSYYGALIPFDEEMDCWLLVPAITNPKSKGDYRKCYVYRVNEHRYVIDLENDMNRPVDPATAATLRLLHEMRKKGQLPVTPDDDWYASIPERLKRTQALADKLDANTPSAEPTKAKRSTPNRTSAAHPK